MILSNKFIENDVRFPDTGQVILRDDLLKGFGLRVSQNCMSYIVECRVGGKVKRITIGKHGQLTADEARKKAQKMLMDIQSAKTSAFIPTLEQTLEEYLASRKLRPNTIKSYTMNVRFCLKDWLQLPVTGITKDMVLAKHKELTRPTRWGTSGESQANMTLRILRTLLYYAANNYETEDGQPIILVNPVKKLSQNGSWHHEPRRRVVIPDHKLGDFYRGVMSLRLKTTRDYLLFVLLTGLRRNEAATLRWTDIDFHDRIITIRAEHAKNKNEHRLPITDFLLLLLTKRKQLCGDSAFVFPGYGPQGHMVDSKFAIRGLAKKVDLDFVLHDLRRTFHSVKQRTSRVTDYFRWPSVSIFQLWASRFRYELLLHSGGLSGPFYKLVFGLLGVVGTGPGTGPIDDPRMPHLLHRHQVIPHFVDYKNMHQRPSVTASILILNFLLAAQPAGAYLIWTDSDRTLYIDQPIANSDWKRIKRCSIFSVSLRDGADKELFRDRALFPRLESVGIESGTGPFTKTYSELSVTPDLRDGWVQLRTDSTPVHELNDYLGDLVSNFPGLKSLTIKKTTPVTDAELESIGEFKQLQRLRIIGEVANTQTLARSLPKGLSYLALWNNQVTAKPAQFPQMMKLKHLDLASCYLTESFLSTLQTPNLEKIELEQVDLTENSFANVGRFKKLREVILVKTDTSPLIFEKWSKELKFRKMSATETIVTKTK